MLTVAETGSTNADLLDLAAGGAEDGIWLRAERQLSGRGRQGRAWDSPAGNLYASHLVRLRAGDPPAASLALVAAVALEEVIARLVSRGTMLKWPNDLLIGGAKISGILLERVGDAVVIGIGVNVAHCPDLPDRAATSLAEQGAAITPAELLERLAAMVEAWLSIWRGQGLAPIVARWIERAHPAGTPLRARLADGTSLDGTFETLAPDGALVLRLADGTTRAIHAGDVFLV
ncbi:biotin--[acetyl-CoA-carboxylase] ligase [Sphingomonas sp. MMSM20]|uniref:biotin--[acetyl-CoA-carboxylase] ligase n=1 Tax=Sphingomonas lycopersici TaxID=2951807 RepID=UPI002237BAF8|nr:biotin--[acetyl-CoA-carboxylase] ligase [Sphingomonas lycopersici]